MSAFTDGRLWTVTGRLDQMRADGAMFALSLFLAYLIRFEFSLSAGELIQFLVLLPFFVLTKTLIFHSLGLYRSLWRFTSTLDAQALVQATALSTLAVFTGIYAVTGFQGYSRAVVLVDGVLSLTLCGCVRLACRLLYMPWSETRPFMLPFLGPPRPVGHRKRVLIIGAGGSGHKLLMEINDNRDLRYEVAGFLDDDKEKIGKSILGVRVLGAPSDLPKILEDRAVDEVLIAAPSATGAQMRRLVSICEDSGVKFKTLPCIGEIVDGRVSIKTLREVSFADLLGRPQVQLNSDKIAGYLGGKVVLVTGGGGSIGSQLCREIVKHNPARLVIVDNSEANLYNIQMELQHEHGFTRGVAVLCRVQDRLLDKIFDRYKPEVVFHAAAYKHVPMMERNPWEVVFNNILGSKNVMERAREHKVERFVLVSTDKAVRPTNVMGASKRITELLLQSMPPSETLFMAVRFGNVLGSSGSVIPLFLKQIEHGGPVTVTHPEVTRYFMSIAEAAMLILQAGSMGEGSEIFLLKMGSPVRITDMAMDLIRLAGKVPFDDVDIKFTGLRPGEKLYEELITAGEGNVETSHEKIMILKPEDHRQYANPEFRAWLAERMGELIEAAHSCDGDLIRSTMKKIVPEYVYRESASSSLLNPAPESRSATEAAVRRPLPGADPASSLAGS